MDETPKIGAILPALNVEAHLGPLLANIGRAAPGVTALVIDDGCTDRTAGGAELIVHPRNMGKGAALLTGFAWAVENGYDWVFTMDADGQHLPAEMPNFLRAAENGKLDVVIGTRMQDNDDMPWLRRMTNIFTSAVISRLCGTRIPDTQNGYRLLRVSYLDGLVLKTRNYDMESEILVRLARRGARLGSVPVSTIYGEQQSSINPVRDTVRFFRLVAALVFDRDG